MIQTFTQPNGDNFRYEMIPRATGDFFCVLLGYSGNSNCVNVPSKIENVPVTIIHNHCFFNHDCLRSVLVPSTVKSVDFAAFRNCKNLSKVTFTSHTENFAPHAFYKCAKNLTIISPKASPAEAYAKASKINWRPPTSLMEHFFKNNDSGSFVSAQIEEPTR